MTESNLSSKQANQAVTFALSYCRAVCEQTHKAFIAYKRYGRMSGAVKGEMFSQIMTISMVWEHVSRYPLLEDGEVGESKSKTLDAVSSLSQTLSEVGLGVPELTKHCVNTAYEVLEQSQLQGKDIGSSTDETRKLERLCPLISHLNGQIGLACFLKNQRLVELGFPDIAEAYFDLLEQLLNGIEAMRPLPFSDFEVELAKFDNTFTHLMGSLNEYDATDGKL